MGIEGALCFAASYCCDTLVFRRAVTGSISVNRRHSASATPSEWGRAVRWRRQSTGGATASTGAR